MFQSRKYLNLITIFSKYHKIINIKNLTNSKPSFINNNVVNIHKNDNCEILQNKITNKITLFKTLYEINNITIQ